MNANVWDQADAIEALLRRTPTVSPEQLVDPDVELLSLADSR